MAKWGQGDPRWIVEDRADATNVNNWHWTEKDASEWSKSQLKELFKGLKIEDDDLTCELTSVSKVDGEASVNNRKAKTIVFYEWKLVIDWKGLKLYISSLHN
jgi:activator of HSP90 ATPase